MLCVLCVLCVCVRVRACALCMHVCVPLHLSTCECLHVCNDYVCIYVVHSLIPFMLVDHSAREEQVTVTAGTSIGSYRY